MARDYAARRNRNNNRNSNQGKRGNGRGKPNRWRQSNPPAKKPTPGWVWLLCGLTIGLLVAIGVYIARPAHQAPAKKTVQQSQPQQDKAAPPVHEGLPPKEKPRFDFYSMLPNRQVVIPQQKYRSPQQKKHPKVTSPGHYLIQAGSFKRHSAADALKARLALLGLEADIKKASLSNGQTWYRVRIGPEDSTKRVNTMMKRLKEHDIDSMVVRIKG